jgi:hypothetical protein
VDQFLLLGFGALLLLLSLLKLLKKLLLLFFFQIFLGFNPPLFLFRAAFDFLLLSLKFFLKLAHLFFVLNLNDFLNFNNLLAHDSMLFHDGRGIQSLLN